MGNEVGSHEKKGDALKNMKESESYEKGKGGMDDENQEEKNEKEKGEGGESDENKVKSIINGFAVESDENHVVVKKRIREKEFEKLKVIGKGLFGIVYLVRKRDNGKFYAMKKMDKRFIIKKKSIRHIKSERFLLAGVSHPFIVNLRFAFQTKRFLYLVMEYVNGGTLFDHLNKDGRFPEKRVQLYAAELFLALEYLHSKKILHRDLKLENILMDQFGHIILTDFGLSKVIKEEKQNKTLCGTLDYLSPEMILVSKKKRKGYGKAIDYYAYGVLLYEMICGYSPFRANSLSDAMRKIVYEEVKFPRNIKISKNAKSFIRKLLKKDPEERLGSVDSSEIKNHPFFNGLDFEQVINRKITPQFIPELSGPDDTKYVNKKFLMMPLRWEGGEDLKGISPNQIQAAKGAFSDFSYASETVKVQKKGN